MFIFRNSINYYRLFKLNIGVRGLKQEFIQHRKVARQNNPSAIPIINELETVAVQRATGKMSPSKARTKIKACCMKVGINPIAIDHSAMEPQFDFNPKRKGNQKTLKLKIPNVFANAKANNPRVRRRALGINIPSIFPASSQPKKQKMQHPTFNLTPKKPKGKVKRFELKPITFGNAPKRKTSKSLKGFKLKPIKFGKWF